MPSTQITTIFLSCATLFLLGCAQELEQPDEVEAIASQEVERKRGAALQLGGEPGSQCSAACIWSPYAVAYGAQDASHSCKGLACACVTVGDIGTLNCENRNISPSWVSEIICHPINE